MSNFQNITTEKQRYTKVNDETKSLTLFSYDKGTQFRNDIFKELQLSENPHIREQLYSRGRFDDKCVLVAPLSKAIYLDNVDEFEHFYIQHKRNGFMLNVTIDLGNDEPQLYYSTTSQIMHSESEPTFLDNGSFVMKGKQFFELMVDKVEFIECFKNSQLKVFLDTFGNPSQRYTLSFECVMGSDYHIVNETFGLFLLSANIGSMMKVRTHNSVLNSLHIMLDEFASNFYGIHHDPLKCVNRKELDMIKSYTNAAMHEGLIIYASHDYKIMHTIKWKSDYYNLKKYIIRKPFESVQNSHGDQFHEKELIQLLFTEMCSEIANMADNVEEYWNNFKKSYTLGKLFDKVFLLNIDKFYE